MQHHYNYWIHNPTQITSTYQGISSIKLQESNPQTTHMHQPQQINAYRTRCQTVSKLTLSLIKPQLRKPHIKQNSQWNTLLNSRLLSIMKFPHKKEWKAWKKTKLTIRTSILNFCKIYIRLIKKKSKSRKRKRKNRKKSISK